jgi:signal transduction histidine kinase
MSISLDGKKIGEATVGHVIPKGHRDQTKKSLERLLLDLNSEEVETKYLLDILDKMAEFEVPTNCNRPIEREFKFISEHFNMDCVRKEYTERRIRDLKKLTENLAHQFITPIQSILGNAEIMIKEYKKLPARCKNVEMEEMQNQIFTETQKLALCADNMRNWIAEELQTLYRYDFEVQSVFPILYKTINIFRAEAKSRGILIKNPDLLGGAPPLLNISEEHFRRVFYNMISNAVKYSYEGTPEKPRWIEIRCNFEDNYYYIDMTNYGIGILPDEVEEKIFETGYRGKLAKDRNRYGSGLGLGVIRRIVEDHGGKVKIFSEPKGDESWGMKNPYKVTVRIYLPIPIDSLIEEELHER